MGCLQCWRTTSPVYTQPLVEKVISHRHEDAYAQLQTHIEDVALFSQIRLAAAAGNCKATRAVVQMGFEWRVR